MISKEHLREDEVDSIKCILTACFPVSTLKAAERLATTEQSVVMSCTKLLLADTCIIASSKAVLSFCWSNWNNSAGLTQAAKLDIWFVDKEKVVLSLTLS